MKVIALPEVQQYLKSLKTILFEKEYFSYEESATKYVDDLFEEIEQALPTKLHKPAPKHFDQYGKGMKYAAFRKNRQTTWYVFFKTYKDKGETFLLVRYISNNHSIAQYL
jgi:hypothetical protein